jgi:hypothetical protein
MGLQGGCDVKYLVAVPIDDATSVVMEIDDEAAGSGVVRSARPGEVIATATESLGAALGQLQPMVQTLIGKLRDLPECPNEIDVEFGLKMTMGAGLVVAHSNAEANFRVQLRWNRA